jgi:Yip1 domain
MRIVLPRRRKELNVELDDSIIHDNPYAAPKAPAGAVQTSRLATAGIDFAHENPFLTIWTRPRATIRGIVDTNPALHVTPLAMIGGVLQALDRASASMRNQLSIATTLIGALIGGSLGGLLSLYFGGWLVRITGRWLGGQAEPEEIRAALAWSGVPKLVTIPIWIAAIVFFGSELFKSATPNLAQHPALWIVLGVTGLIEFVLATWSFVIVVKCLAEVQQFSGWRALASMFLAGLLIFVPLITIFLAVLMARH